MEGATLPIAGAGIRSFRVAVARMSINRIWMWLTCEVGRVAGGAQAMLATFDDGPVAEWVAGWLPTAGGGLPGWVERSVERLLVAWCDQSDEAVMAEARPGNEGVLGCRPVTPRW